MIAIAFGVAAIEGLVFKLVHTVEGKTGGRRFADGVLIAVGIFGDASHAADGRPIPIVVWTREIGVGPMRPVVRAALVNQGL